MLPQGGRYRNMIPTSKMTRLRLQSAAHDLALIEDYLETGAYDDADVEALAVWAENLQVTLSEQRMSIEVSASARTCSDAEYEGAVQEFVDEFNDEDE